MPTLRFGPAENDRPGYWGPPTSSIDWCESNYVVSFYVAEFFNTISNLATLVAAAYIYRNVRKIGASVEFTLASLAIAIVGLGSAAFHGTLLFEAQLLDELPMLYSQVILIYSLCINSRTPRRGLLVAMGLAVAVVYSTWHAYTRPVVAFQVLFLLLLLVIFALNHKYNGDLALAQGAWVFLLLTVGSSVLWKLDQVLCPVLEKAYLHAIWHVGTAAASAVGTIGIMYSRARYIDADDAVTLTWKLRCIPSLQRVKRSGGRAPNAKKTKSS